MMRLCSACRGTWSAPSPSYVTRQLRACVDDVIVRSMLIWSSSQMESDRPTTSKPGPVRLQNHERERERDGTA